MLQLFNNTAFNAEHAILFNQQAAQVLIVLVKASFAYDEDGTVNVVKPEPIVTSPEYYPTIKDSTHGPFQSTLLRDNEWVVAHQGTDVSLYGTAYSIDQPSSQLDVSLTINKHHKTVRVFGHRVWQQGRFLASISDPEPFTTMPLRYENSYGGASTDQAGEPQTYLQNPIGKGYAATLPVPKKSLDGIPLPNIEAPKQLIQKPSDQPPPACFAAIPGSWEPRLSHCGTTDAVWQAERFPLPPLDFNVAHYNTATPDLMIPTPLKGGEHITLTHLHPNQHYIALHLPKLRIVVRTEIHGQWRRHAVKMDRLMIDTDKQQCHMVWGARLACGTQIKSAQRTIVENKVYIR